MIARQMSKGRKLGMRLFLLACSGCSGAASSGSSSAGGSTSHAGAPTGAADGGSRGQSDSTGAGGSMAMGGSIISAGGSSNAGAPTTGGSESVGGRTTGSGGSSTGGTATGGMLAVGGTAGRGRGGRATGGVKATGGVPGAGGSQAGGGASGLGGTPSSAGASSGGASSSTGCSNTALPAACNTSMTGPCTIDVGGTARQYFAVLPNNYAANTPYPIVFLWHGASTTAQMYIGGGPIAYYGIRTGFPNAIYVAAQGLPSTEGGTDYGWANTNGQDVAFTKAMIASLESNYCVDTKRLFSTGFSYGGIMSLTLACQMGDVFRAIGVMSGTMFGGAGGCQTTPIPAWFTHGEADMTLAISGGESARDALIKRNGCDTTNTQTAAMSDGMTMCTIYDVCTSGDPVVWCPVPGEAHQIPSFAGPEIAKFFLQY